MARVQVRRVISAVHRQQLDLDEVRDVVLKDLVEEQLLPVDRESHPASTVAGGVSG